MSLWRSRSSLPLRLEILAGVFDLSETPFFFESHNTSGIELRRANRRH
jgi:hypothetical protein